MDSIHLLGIAFGLAMLSGLNLYLTIFASGLAIRMQWITLSPDFHQLAFLSDSWILGISGTFLLFEFFADKIPWVDSFWDTLHTVIRPLGGALLATRVMGDASPTFLVIVGLLAGTLSLSTHAAKAGTRIIANASPEPFSNIGLSLGEDAAVLGGLALLHLNPLLAIALFFLLFIAGLYFAPKLFRAVRVRVWFAFRKLTLPAFGRPDETLSRKISGSAAAAFSEMNLLGETLLWAVPCVSRKGPGIPANLFGTLIATVEETGKLLFIADSRWAKIRHTLELEGGSVERVAGFLSDEIRLADAAGKRRYVFAFDRGRSPAVEEITESIRRRIARSAELIPSYGEVPL